MLTTVSVRMLGYARHAHGMLGIIRTYTYIPAHVYTCIHFIRHAHDCVGPHARLCSACSRHARHHMYVYIHTNVYTCIHLTRHAHDCVGSHARLCSACSRHARHHMRIYKHTYICILMYTFHSACSRLCRFACSVLLGMLTACSASYVCI